MPLGEFLAYFSADQETGGAGDKGRGSRGEKGVLA